MIYSASGGPDLPMYVVMDPVNLAMSLTNLKAAEMAMRVQYAVAAKVLRTANDQGDAMVKLIQSAAEGFEQAVAQVNAATDPIRMLDVYG